MEWLNLRLYLILMLLSTGVLQVSGQVENIQIDEHTTMDKLYAGLYPRWLTATDSLAFQDQVSLRVGARLTHVFNETFNINAQAALQMENERELLPIIDYAFQTRLTDRLQLRLGSFATPNTLLRPNPITWQGQSETYAQSRIIPGRPGALLAYAMKNGKNLYVGYHDNDDYWAWHAMLDLNEFAFSGWLQQNEDYFIHLEYKTEKNEAILNYTNVGEEWSSSVFHHISERFTIYADANYRVNSGSTDVFRLGARSYFKNANWHVKGFMALQYDFAVDVVSAEFFIHLH